MEMKKTMKWEKTFLGHRKQGIPTKADYPILVLFARKKNFYSWQIWPRWSSDHKDLAQLSSFQGWWPLPKNRKLFELIEEENKA